MISIHDVYRAFAGSFNLNVKILREFCHVRTVEFVPKEGSPLRTTFEPNASFRIPLDYIIAPGVILNHSWDPETALLVRKIVEGRFTKAILVDVGANSGLFTRSILASNPEFIQSFAYEPHPENFSCLRHNVAPFSYCHVHNSGLGPETGAMNFYIDPNNSGNYSLNASAMPKDVTHESISVSIKSASSEATVWLDTNLPIFYKSDTQGYDEVIATSMDIALWDRVFAGIMELWQIEKPSYSVGKLSTILEKFPHKRFLQDPLTPITTSEVLSYQSGTDRTFKDVLFWK